jgi:cephalosporin hydroxylase
MNFEMDYQLAVIKDTDIHEHLPLLSDLTSECSHVTELGVGWAQSTRAFLRHDIELHSYEYKPHQEVLEYFEKAKAAGRRVTLHVADTRQVEIAETDLMLVDSLHIYEQVTEELRLHAPKVRKYIVFHDTTTFADNGEFGGKGIWPAVQEFIDSHPEWQMIERKTNNNGLTVLKKVS